MTASPPAPGWVYILTNPALPGMVKVGLTTRNPAARAAELTSSSGVPLPFTVAWARAVSDCAFVEKAVHRMLDDRRVSGRREFFRCDARLARQVIEAAAGGQLGRRYRSQRPQRTRRRAGRRTRDHSRTVLALGALAVLAVAVSKPALPAWMPGWLIRTTLLIEHQP